MIGLPKIITKNQTCFWDQIGLPGVPGLPTKNKGFSGFGSHRVDYNDDKKSIESRAMTIIRDFGTTTMTELQKP